MDGLPIYKNNTREVWPLLVRIINAKDSKPFAVSIYLGDGKPSSAENYLRPFVEELKPLLHDGITIDGVHYDVEVASFCCDAPARQFAKGISGHCGREACERCTQKGKNDNNGTYMLFKIA